jgi:hypothetical protein
MTSTSEEQFLSLEDNSRLRGEEVPLYYGSQQFITREDNSRLRGEEVPLVLCNHEVNNSTRK